MSDLAPRWDEQTVVVTGGARGIGAEFATAFADLGARVAIADLDESAGEQLESHLRGLGQQAIFIPTDVSDDRSVSSLFAQAESWHGGVHVVVNNAAIYMDLGGKAPFDEISVRDWDRVMAVNARGVWNCARAAAPAMRQRQYGRMVNVTSASVFSGVAGFAHYVASKAAVVGLTRVLARELGGDSITVNAIAPGLVAGPASSAINDDQYLTGAATMRSIPRGMTAMDLIGAATFLASPDSAFITGQVLVVDGGALMR